MAFLAPFIPEAAAGAEALGSALLGKEGLEGLSKLANVAISQFSKENGSPSKLLSKIANKGLKVAKDPKKVKHVLEEGGKALGVATGAGKHLTGVLNKSGVLSDSRTAKLHQSLNRVNNSFHNALGKLGKISSKTGLLPFLHK